MSTTLASREPQPALDLDTTYRKHRSPCFALAMSIVRDHHLAEDVLQDVFECLQSNPSQFDQTRGSMATWLKTLTHHRSVDLIRLRHRRTHLDDGREPPANLVDFTATPEEALLRSEERVRLFAALRQVTAGEREAILLAYFEGLSQTAISELTGVPLGTVKSRTLRGLQRLRQLLNDTEDYPRGAASPPSRTALPSP